MLSGIDDTAFDGIMRDLALAFDRPHDVERVRVFWEALKHVSLGEVKRLAANHRKHGKKFPAPRDLMPEKPPAPASQTAAEDPRYASLSTWWKNANLILYHVAYCDRRRGLVPLGEVRLAELLRVKRDIVGMAEQDDYAGSPWSDLDFNATCKHAFEKILGLSGVVEPSADQVAA